MVNQLFELERPECFREGDRFDSGILHKKTATNPVVFLYHEILLLHTLFGENQ